MVAISLSDRKGGPVIGIRGWLIPLTLRSNSLSAGAPELTTGPLALPFNIASRVSSLSPAGGVWPKWQSTHF
jgi:hypothetical protein